jgi:hypothetical protein
VVALPEFVTVTLAQYPCPQSDCSERLPETPVAPSASSVSSLASRAVPQPTATHPAAERIVARGTRLRRTDGIFIEFPRFGEKRHCGAIGASQRGARRGHAGAHAGSGNARRDRFYRKRMPENAHCSTEIAPITDSHPVKADARAMIGIRIELCIEPPAELRVERRRTMDVSSKHP